MIGDKTLYFDVIDSTNKFLKDNWMDLPSETVVWAKKQISGRGRKGNLWISEEGGLWFSTLFKPSKRTIEPQYYIKMYSLAICDMLSKYKINAKIKWPNDVLIKNEKICGIMAENIFLNSRAYAVIVGVGININNQTYEGFENPATSLYEQTNKKVNLEKFLNELNHKVYYNYYLKYTKKMSLNVLTKKWKKNLNIFPEMEVLVQYPEGKIEKVKILEIYPDYLEVANYENEIKKIFSGEIKLIKN